MTEHCDACGRPWVTSLTKQLLLYGLFLVGVGIGFLGGAAFHDLALVRYGGTVLIVLAGVGLIVLGFRRGR